ncbi:N-acetylmuramic acid 6-phosphate etherase [Pseudonocardia thermophila]|uniref:N-acetylmuramic acid 6-phosphate etherase n=1 Tax=Pseudonocardia thermophila TaxID=1848 RepID=A0A1M7B3G5_PSETH|nr:N-acetylmuramic acid 6-phosphate etherase [Pseudonocardia thermophila]SHL49491.1 N-acetylmuramic acid 6-phosphate etherase [Pseudonocardia thermophila]
MSELDRLSTEGVQPGLEDLNERPPAAIVDVLLAAEARVPAVLAAAAAQLGTAVEVVERGLRAGGRLIYVGAGTPGRLAALDAAECVPTFGVPPGLVVAVLAGGAEAAARAVEGAEDDAAAGAADLRTLAPGPADTVVGITASGRTPFVLGALGAARAAGAATIAIVNNPGSAAAAAADVAVELLTGPEVIAGSTRLTAGTSQKIALNVLSTAAMVRIGRTHGPWMIDVRATNQKLRRRAQRTLVQITGESEERVAEALRSTGGDTREALALLRARQPWSQCP